MPSPTAVAHRHLILRRLIERHDVSSQDELRRRLASQGHVVSQTTVSRDLGAIRAARETLPNGGVVYRASSAQDGANELGSRLRQFVHEITCSANIVVVRTPPGSAHAVGVALDNARASGNLRQALGTVAGDDTLLIVTRSASGGSRLARKLESMLEA